MCNYEDEESRIERRRWNWLESDSMEEGVGLVNKYHF